MRPSNTQSGCLILTVNSNTNALDNSTVTTVRRALVTMTEYPLAAVVVDDNMEQTVNEDHVATSNSANNKRVANQGDQRRWSKVFLEGTGVVTDEEGGGQSSVHCSHCRARDKSGCASFVFEQGTGELLRRTCFCLLYLL